MAAVIEYFAWVGQTMAGDYLHKWSHLSGRRQTLHAAMDCLLDYEKSLASRLIDGLMQLDGVKIQGISAADAMDRRVPTVAFTHQSVPSDAIARALGQQNIFVWSGHNYAVEVARTLGIYDTGGAVRVGLVHYNGAAEVDELLQELGRLLASGN